MAQRRKFAARLLTSLLAIAILAFLTGCAWTDRHGTRHVAIIGFGIVSVTNQQGAVVQDVRGLGLVLDHSINLGLVQRHRVEIDPNYATNLVLAIHATPFELNVKNFNSSPGARWAAANTNQNATP